MRFCRDPWSAAWEWSSEVGRLAERPETVAVARAMLTWWDGIDLEGEAPDDEARAYCLVLLANRLWDVPQRDIRGPLQRAIECYQAALRIYTEETAPQEWATTQNNLGTAYSDLPTSDRGENLRRAIEYYEAALRVYTEEADPEGHARLCNNLAWVLAHDMEPSRPSEALPLAEKAVSLAPESATLDTLAHCYYRLERWSEALEAWDRALALDPSYVDDYGAYEGLELREMVEEARRRAAEA